MALATAPCPWCDEEITCGSACSYVRPTPQHGLRVCLACGWAAFNEALASRYKRRAGG